MTEIATEMVEEIKTATNGQLNITVRLAGEMPYAVSEYLQDVYKRQVGERSMARLIVKSPYIKCGFYQRGDSLTQRTTPLEPQESARG